MFNPPAAGDLYQTRVSLSAFKPSNQKHVISSPSQDPIRKLSQNDNSKRSIPINLMRNIHRRRILQLEQLPSKRAKTKYIRRLLPKDRDDGHSNLGTIADAFKVNRNPNKQSDQSKRRVKNILRAMMMRSGRV